MPPLDNVRNGCATAFFRRCGKNQLNFYELLG
jgi:hypothetical protein